MDVLLLRIRDHNEMPTPGVLFIHGYPVLTSLEPPNLNNLPNVSCIPVGTYECVLRHKVQISKEVYPSIYEVTGVSGRSRIFFHIGNFKEDTKGCILLGTTFHEAGVGNSKVAYQIFMDKLKRGLDLTHLKQRESFALTIRFAR